MLPLVIPGRQKQQEAIHCMTKMRVSTIVLVSHSLIGVLLADRSCESELVCCV